MIDRCMKKIRVADKYPRLKLLRLEPLHIVGCVMTANLPVGMREENAPSRNG